MSTPAPAQEVKISMSDPTAIGVFGLSMITFVASASKMGWITGTAYLIPWAIFLGCFGQLWAAAIDYKRNNYFGAIVLGAYGLFWLAVAVHWMGVNGIFGEAIAKADGRAFAFACFGYFIFSAFILIAAMEANKVFFLILILIEVLLASLGFATLGYSPVLFGKLAAWSELLISLLGFYACGAVFLNNFFGRTMLSLGAPLGIIRKGP